MVFSFTCKVIAVHPAFDPTGQEFVCVELGYELKIPPAIVATPMEMPAEFQALPRMIQQAFPKPRGYANRLVLYFTPEEFEQVRSRFLVGEEFQVTIDDDGIHARKI